VDRFACDWHRLATTDPKNPTALIIAHFARKGKRNFLCFPRFCLVFLYFGGFCGSAGHFGLSAQECLRALERVQRILPGTGLPAKSGHHPAEVVRTVVVVLLPGDALQIKLHLLAVHRALQLGTFGLQLFIRPGGLFIFDLRSPEWLRSMDGQIYVDEQDDVLCLWRADLVEDEGLIVYGMDIFSNQGGLWRREREEHEEFIHEFEFLKAALEKEGFRDIILCKDAPQVKLGRQFITAIRGE